MKLQDIVFLLILLALFYRHKARDFVILGLLLFTASIPLFAKWVFFTAERLTWYGAFCMLIAVILLALQERKQYENRH